MAIYIISEAKPKLGALVKQASAGKTIYLLNGKDMVALVPAHPTHDLPSNLDVPAVNRRLAASERTPSAPNRSINSNGSGEFPKDLDILRPCLSLTIPVKYTFLNGNSPLHS